MIGVRVECDEEGCGRHFEVGGHELTPMPSVMLGTGEVGVVFAGQLVCPAGWAVGEEHPGIVRVLCGTHAPAHVQEMAA
jgi:hypothetical protein